jgi:hypothetical protein
MPVPVDTTTEQPTAIDVQLCLFASCAGGDSALTRSVPPVLEQLQSLEPEYTTVEPEPVG